MSVNHALREEKKKQKQEEGERAQKRREDWKKVRTMIILSTGLALIVLLVAVAFSFKLP